ncbi:MAG: ABC transporter permease [Waddliaceae bacterium]|nr:ABC transporter permease [Waddliaceae bacterium]
MESPLFYFTDPVLRGPTIACMLMCLASSLVGVMVYLRKQSLLGESLSHAAYPGVLGGVLLGVFVFAGLDEGPLLAAFILIGAFLSALLGLWIIEILTRHLSVRNDAALCFVLSMAFGIGITAASRLQFTHTQLYRHVNIYFYGQAATMTDLHVLVYACISLLVVALISLMYKELQLITFDRDFASIIGIRTKTIDTALFILIVLAVVVGIRSVGVVLMSAMLIAPAVSARQWTNRLSVMLILAALFGLSSGFMGNYLSVELGEYFSNKYPNENIALPTGPMIVLVAMGICFVSLFLAPERGLLSRLGRIFLFRYKCIEENFLKALWRINADGDVTWLDLSRRMDTNRILAELVLFQMRIKGYIFRKSFNVYQLTGQGRQRATHVVRLHRLWELYLVDEIGIGAEKVHRNAEEMEHIITPNLEKRLSELLKDPKVDPHQQPIPPSTQKG